MRRMALCELSLDDEHVQEALAFHAKTLQ